LNEFPELQKILRREGLCEVGCWWQVLGPEIENSAETLIEMARSSTLIEDAAEISEKLAEHADSEFLSGSSVEPLADTILALCEKNLVSQLPQETISRCLTVLGLAVQKKVEEGDGNELSASLYAAFAATSLMSSPDVHQTAVREEVLEPISELLREALNAYIYPALEGKTDGLKTLQKAIGCCTSLMTQLASLLVGITVSDSVLVLMINPMLNSFFTENAEHLQISAMALLRAV